MTHEMTAAERRDTKRLALAIVETCVRNTGLETLHAVTFPPSATGDYTDVKVVALTERSPGRRSAGFPTTR